MKKIAIYCKGGIEKSTTTSNLSAALDHKRRIGRVGLVLTSRRMGFSSSLYSKARCSSGLSA